MIAIAKGVPAQSCNTASLILEEGNMEMINGNGCFQSLKNAIKSGKAVSSILKTNINTVPINWSGHEIANSNCLLS